MSLSDIVKTIPATGGATVDIDISKWAPDTIITLGEPSVAQIFQAGSDAEVIRKENSDFPDTLCQTIALLAVCHRAPEPGGSTGRLYVEIARKNRDLALHLMTQLSSAFPEMINLSRISPAKKKPSGKPTGA